LLAIGASIVVAAEVAAEARRDPYLDRVVREAIELGERSKIDRDLPDVAKGLFMPLEDAKDLQASLLSISSDILGTPHTQASEAEAPAKTAPAVATLTVQAPSFIEKSEFSSMLEGDEKKIREQTFVQEELSKLAKEKVESAKIMEEVDSIASDVNKFDIDLTLDGKGSAGEADPVQAFLALDQEAVNTDSAAIEGSAEATAEDATAEATEDATEEEVAFAEISESVRAVDHTLASALEKVETPAPKSEILEPTFSEEAEGAVNPPDVPWMSFLLTKEELRSQLDALGIAKK